MEKEEPIKIEELGNEVQKEVLTFKKKVSTFYKKNEQQVKYSALIAGLLVLVAVAVFARYRFAIRQYTAATHQASLTFQPQNSTLPPQSSFGLWINSDSPVAFANVNLTVNPTLVSLASE